MFLSGTTLYYANRNDGSLHSESFANGTPDSTTDAVVNSPATGGNDWRAEGMFLYGAPTFPNQPPTAVATTSGCTGLTCSFSGSTSSDPDGTIASYAWNFGDGTTSTAVSPSHTYAAAGNYTATLTVTDNSGASSPPSTVGVSPVAPLNPLAYVGEAHAITSGTSVSVTAPAGITAGDKELLFVSVNTAGITTSAPSGLTGWTQVSQAVSSNLVTTVYSRTATSGDSGTAVGVTFSATVKATAELVDYTGVSSAAVTVASTIDANTATHTSSAITVGAGSSWVLTYWADRSSGTTAWTLPSTVTSRGLALGTGGGTVTSVLTDSGGPVLTTGTYPAATATSMTATGPSVSGRGATISIVLASAS